jgi:hypothetical protein
MRARWTLWRPALRVVDVVAFEERDELGFVGQLQVEAA